MNDWQEVEFKMGASAAYYGGKKERLQPPPLHITAVVLPAQGMPPCETSKYVAWGNVLRNGGRNWL